ncbi:MAG: hypothetical protein J5654_04400 [Victivallales bacterium]|nr:hypothetical protein [Victivallales bacterium]
MPKAISRETRETHEIHLGEAAGRCAAGGFTEMDKTVRSAWHLRETK